MNDISIVKFTGQSKLTLEGYLGYFLITKNGDFKYDVLQYPLSLSSMINVGIRDDFRSIQLKIPQIRRRMMNSLSEIKDINADLEKFIGKKVSSDGTFKHKLVLSIQSEDTEVVSSIIEEFFKEWVNPIKMDVDIQEMSFPEFSKQLSRVGNSEDAFKVIKREDLKDLSEAYPIVDPIAGKSVNDFRIGEKIYFTVLRFANDHVRSEMMSKFPNDFNAQGENVSPLIGRIISKEFVPEFGEDFTLIKIECQSFYFKALVLNSINLMTTSVGIPIIGDSRVSATEKPKVKEEEVHLHLIDILVAMILVAGIVGTALTIMYFFFVK